MDDIIFSIIIPAYNASKTIEQAIKSIQSTTISLEIIIIDDGSLDNTLEILSEIQKKDDRIIVIHQDNCGVSLSRNVGMKKSKGKYIMFLDADDSFYKVNFDELLEIMEVSDLGIFGYYISEDFTEMLPSLSGLFGKKIISSEYEKLNRKNLINPVWNKCFKKSIIEKNKLEYEQNISIGEDLLFFLNYYKFCGVVYFINKAFYKYTRSTQNSLSKKMHYNSFDIQKRLKTKVEEVLFDCESNQYVTAVFVTHIINDCHSIILNNDKNHFFVLKKWLENEYFYKCFCSCESFLPCKGLEKRIIKRKQIVLLKFFWILQRIYIKIKNYLSKNMS